MKLVVREHVRDIIEVETTTYNITVDPIDAYQQISAGIGQMKGDLIVFRGPGDPVRIASGNIAGRILSTDPTTETGWAVIPNSSSSGSSVTLHNITGTYVAGGTVVKISSDYDFVKATSADTTLLFVTAEDCDDDADVVCYGVANTVCTIQCTSGAVAVGDELGVSSTDGVAETVASNGFAVALTAKASGSAGTVEAIIQQNGFLPLSGGDLSGNLKIKKSAPQIIFENPDGNSSAIMGRSPSQNLYGGILLIQAGGNCIVGGGEFPNNAFSNDVEGCTDDGERLLLGADGYVCIISNAQTIENRKTWKFNTDGSTTLPAPLTAANGGTGQTSLQATRNAMGLGNTTGALPIANGGTGATSVSGARTNLGFQNGYTSTLPSAVNVASGTDTTVFTLSLSKGVYLLVYEAVFAKNTNGYRRLWATSSSDNDLGYIYKDTCRANGQDVSMCRCTVFHTVSASSETIKFKVTQDSGSSLNVTFRYQYMKLG